jgi:hypothetical protein
MPGFCGSKDINWMILQNVNHTKWQPHRRLTTAKVNYTNIVRR